jgi:hypothetical protein
MGCMIVTVNSVNKSMFIMVRGCVLLEVGLRTEFLNVT